MNNTITKENKPTYKELFNHFISTAPSGSYRTGLYNYSIMNNLLLYFQGAKDKVATFKQWNEQGYRVKKGAKAKSIRVPIRVPINIADKESDDEKLIFLYKSCIFSIDDVDKIEKSELDNVDTAGFEAKDAPPTFDIATVLKNLGIDEVPFRTPNNQTLGYAIPSKKQIAVSSLLIDKIPTYIHEMAHCLMHTELSNSTEKLSHEIKEFEAESVAVLTCLHLGLKVDIGKSKDYVLSYMRELPVDEKVLSRIFKTTNTIVQATKTI